FESVQRTDLVVRGQARVGRWRIERRLPGELVRGDLADDSRARAYGCLENAAGKGDGGVRSTRVLTGGALRSEGTRTGKRRLRVATRSGAARVGGAVVLRLAEGTITEQAGRACADVASLGIAAGGLGVTSGCVVF